MTRSNITTLILLVLALQACTDRPGVDKFYTDRGEYDMSRFPLIKPYEAVTLIPPVEPGWFIGQTDSDTSTIENVSGVKALNKRDSIIFAYAENTIIYGQEVNEGWFLIIPKSHKFFEFKTQKEYLHYLDSIGVPAPKLFDPFDVLEYYFAKDTLDWEEYNKTH